MPDLSIFNLRNVCLAVIFAAAVAVPTFSAIAQHVEEVTIAAPDIIAVQVRDPPFSRGSIRRLEHPSLRSHGTWIQLQGQWAMVIGPTGEYVRVADVPPSKFLDRARIDDASRYDEISGRKVIAVYRKSVPYDSGIYRHKGGATRKGASLKHYIYLKLDRPLNEGSHTICWPTGALPKTHFEFSERQTRALGIRVNQHGYRGDDEGKVAYLSLWLPAGPDEGAVDFRKYGINAFHILNDQGSTVFSGAIKLRKKPRDPESGNGFRSRLLEYASSSSEGVPVTAIEATDSVMIAAPGHEFKSGDRIFLHGFDGVESRLNGFATIAAASATTLEIDNVKGAELNTYRAGSAVAVPTYRANRAGTFVFELDFSGWNPETEGDFRIYIPRLGVSDTFKIRDDTWLLAGQVAVGGLYNHRSGIALDGRFGFSRPAPFRPGGNTIIRESKLPLIWSKQSRTGFISHLAGTKKPWLTDRLAPSSYWGGYMDAGDTDRRIRHLDISFLLLDVYEYIPLRTRAMPLGIPKSSEVLDPDIYSEIDDVDDLLHEVIWNIDFYRRLQRDDGRVSGGIENGRQNWLEPSFLYHQSAFVYAPDHVASYRYAASAAKLATVLSALNKAQLAELFRESAVRAWKSAETGQNNPDAYYAESLAIAGAAGLFAKVPWAVRKAKIKKFAAHRRLAAAAALFRLTGESEYHDILKKGWKRIKDLSSKPYLADAAWEYLNAPHVSANSPIKKKIRELFAKAARMIVRAQRAAAYPSMKHPYAPSIYGQGLAPDYNQAQLLIRAHHITGDPALRRAMQVASAQILGANQVGLSFTTGLGKRTIKHPLHLDHIAMGVEAPSGITIFGWAPQAKTAYKWVFGPFWSPLPVSGTRENAASRRVEPNPFQMPFYEYIIEHPLVIMQQEYTVHQTIGTTAAVWLYLHATAGLRQ